MVSKEKAKHPVLKLLIILVLTLMLVCMGAFGFFQIKYEKQIQQSNNPRLIVDTFLEALMQNDLRFAKKLVMHDQKVLIDRWKTDTNHQPRYCPGIWTFHDLNWSIDDLFEQVAWTVSDSSKIDDNTIAFDSVYRCTRNDYLIHIEGLIVKYNGKDWKITRWDRICESSSEENAHEICYPKDK